jgi:hypothetical protein
MVDYKQDGFIFKTDTAIIVTSHPGHRMFLETTLRNYMKTGKYVICSYDSHNQWPHTDLMNIPHTWVTKPKTYANPKRIGWLYDVVLAGGMLRSMNNIEAVIITNGDCLWEKPENVDKLRDVVVRNDGDMMCVTSDSVLHTAAMVMKHWVFQMFIDYAIAMLENPVPESYSPEVLMRDFVKARGIKHIAPGIQPIFPEGHRYAGKVDHYASYNQDSLWKRLVGFRNLGGEHKAACYEHLEPVEKKYFHMGHPPIYFSAHEQQTLYMYFKTGDRRWLWKYWSEGEESFFNNRYYPLEFYGHGPQYDDERRLEHGPPTEIHEVFDRFKTSSYVLKDKQFDKKWKAWIEERYPQLLKG